MYASCRFLFKHFVRVLVVQLYNSTYTVTSWKNSRFIFAGRADFYMSINLSIADNAFPMRMLISLSVDEILQPRYVNYFTNI